MPEPNDLLVDVTYTFTEEPIPDSFIIMEDLFPEDDQLYDHLPLVKKSLTSTYCLFQGEFCQQTSGSLMGFQLSPVASYTFMETFQAVALKFSRYKSEDDTFTI